LNYENSTVQLIHKNDAGVMYWVEDSYLYHRHYDVNHLQEDEGAEFLVAVAELFTVKVPLIFDRIHSYSVDDALMQFVSKHAPLYFTAIAFVSHNANTLWANNYSRDRYSPNIPAEVFHSRLAALTWVRNNQFDCGTIPSGR